MISEMKKIGRQTRSKNDSALYGIEITSKVIEYILVFSYRTLIDIDQEKIVYLQDYQNFFFGSPKEQNQRRNLFENLTRLIFPFANIVVDITNPVQFFSVR